ncbi:hypothetical protein ES703_118654 [subsurface metagenome]
MADKIALMNYSQGKQKNIKHQLLKWSLVGFVLVATVFLWLVASSSLLGYRLVSINGTSMEPALYHGDALWTECVDAAELNIADIVILESIVHRLIKVQPLDQGYILETRGDANCCSEIWEIGLDEKVRVSVTRIGYVGYVLEFLGSIGGIVLIIGLAALAIAIYVHRGPKLL